MTSKVVRELKRGKVLNDFLGMKNCRDIGMRLGRLLVFEKSVQSTGLRF